MSKSDTVTDLEENVQHSGKPFWIAGAVFLFHSFDSLGQRFPMNHLHGEIYQAVFIDTEFVYRADIGMFELSLNLRFPDKPFDKFTRLLPVSGDDLHGHVPTDVAVESVQDDSHTAAGDLTRYLVPAGAGIGLKFQNG